MVIDVVFIGGIHGVGKTSYCSRIAHEYNVEHVTASALISRHIKHSTDKTVEDINKNQRILSEELSRFHTDRASILLDGHFCLLDKDNNIQDIPLVTFQSISPRSIILLMADPSIISSRLSKRDSSSFRVDFLKELQERELARAHFIAESLNIPILVVDLDENSSTFPNNMNDIFRQESV